MVNLSWTKHGPYKQDPLYTQRDLLASETINEGVWRLKGQIMFTLEKNVHQRTSRTHRSNITLVQKVQKEQKT